MKKLGCLIGLVLLFFGCVNTQSDRISRTSFGGGSGGGVFNGGMINKELIINNVQGAPGKPDLMINLDPNHDDAVAFQTNDPTNGDWWWQATDGPNAGNGNPAEIELVSAEWEPFLCWGNTTGLAGITDPAFYNGTCGFQQPDDHESPFHLITSTATPTGSHAILDVETPAGVELWRLDSFGTMAPLKGHLAALPSCTGTQNGTEAIMDNALNAAACSDSIGAIPTTGGNTWCGVICNIAIGWVHY